ncbi:transcription factor/nuclear export subunit protein 2-domain-containing protein [Boletus reticuloceps]|uniref:THO complex subunit 2 n=1 Tax=Boletus reticuloceps TaxID=495285 RepID=A0A8I3AAY2_9AGAM|nr:transcription factor/nuclear export subunit protein 2-domain-containing protein [Boletus reticuloceps]
MNVVDKVRSCLEKWPKSGETECRKFLLPAHLNPMDPDTIDTLTTAYHTLLFSALRTWTPSGLLTPQSFVDFVESVLVSLPSSSVQSRPMQSDTLFGELLVDIVWSLDAQLDELVTDAKATITNVEQTTSASDLHKATGIKQTAEQDKELLVDVVKRLLLAGIIDVAVCRERLDLSLLANIGLVLDRLSFDKKEIRTRTSLLYKQNKFNLLREQSEGYSKLCAEVMSSLGPSHSPQDGRPIESAASIEDRSRIVWDKVMGLIGYFDLDPNRALDIILDVLTVNITTHYTFSLSLLSFSPWASSIRRSIAGKLDVRISPTPSSDKYRGKSLDEVLEIAETLSLSHKGLNSISSGPESRVLAQVLGFKFAYYQGLDVHEPLPKGLYLAAAILIREGFVSLEELYPHLSPSDEDIESYHKDYLDQVHQRIADAKVTQLAMAAPLESTNGSKARSEPVEEIKKVSDWKPPNQKAALVSALLSVGALRPAFAILTKFPWFVDAHVELADLVLRVLRHSIAPLYDTAFVLKERNPSFTQPRARYSSTGVLLTPTRKPQMTVVAPTPPSTATTEFVFFFPDWSERVPLSTTFEDLVDVIEPLMGFVGLHMSRDPLFVSKVTRLGRSQLMSTATLDPVTKKPTGEPDPLNPVRMFWFKLLRLYLLPSLPLIRGNAVCTVEIWNIIRQYETTARWKLYGEWKTSTYNLHPELRIRQVQADRESKGILRRLSHQTIDTLSGTVAKLAHSNPCIFFANAVNQIMAYDNLAGVVIQALRYVTNMGFDVLVYVILDALSNPYKNRVKDDGVNISDWLQSLASFTGMLFRRYSADLSPLLKYVVHQLYNGQTTEIVVLRELIWKMAGIEPLPSLSDSQIAAMAGGPALRIEAIASATRGARLDPGDAILKGPQRLGKSLLETSLALPLLIQVAQQRQSCVFKAPDTHLKSLASLFDTTHGVLLQYLDLLTSPAVVSPEDYAKRILPSLADLGDLYGISASICMQIIRPMLNSILLKTALSMQEKERVANEEAEKRLKARLGANTPRDNFEKPPLVEGNEDNAMDVELEITTPAAESPWIPELEALFDDVRKIAKSNAIDVIGPAFYLTFWQLSMYDLSPPAARYDEEGAALRTLSRQEDAKYISADRSSDRAKRLTASSHRARRDRCNAFVNTLAQEFKEQTASRVFTLKRLAREKQHWFAHVEHRYAVLASAIIEHCIQPRCLLSPMDADYCAQIIKVVHTQGTLGFPTLMCYDKLLGDHVKTVIFSCSEYEAKNYGRFLLGVLTDLWKWVQDEQSFAQDNRAKIGGRTVCLPGFQPRWTNKDLVNIVPEDLLSWSGFKQILRKWHRKLGRSLCNCIETGEFMHVYNAIIVLKEILPVFPLAAVGEYGPVIDNIIDKLVEGEERGDLKILSRAYSAALKKRESQWTVSRPTPPKLNGGAMSPKPASSASLALDKSRSAQLPNGSVREISTASGVQTPLRTQSSTQITDERSSTPASLAKLAIESIPRPERVKRVRPEKGSESPAPDGDNKLQQDIMDVDVIPTAPKEGRTQQEPAPLRFGVRQPSVPVQNSLPPVPIDTRAPALTKEVPKPSRPAFSPREPPLSPRQRIEDKQIQEVMPPPNAPSQTLSAQELRETAKQTIGHRAPDKSDDRWPAGDIRSQPDSGAPSPLPRRRTASPGTRNHSPESRASGERRSDRGTTDVEHGDGRALERESRQESRLSRKESSAAHGPRSERVSSHRTSARESDRERENDRERDRDRGRDRHGERERDRERDKERDREREKDKDRERRDRDRERDRDRDRDRDRHRRDDKDRDRESRKDRDRSSQIVAPATSTTAPEPRSLPTRPDPSRHRPATQVGDDALGKRRRLADDDVDRTSKRSSRKDSHREDRGRRSEKDSHDRLRDSDRHRPEPQTSEGDSRPLVDKPTEKRIPDGPKALPPTTPSAPRAMSSMDGSRGGSKVDPGAIRGGGDWKGQQRDHGPHAYPVSTAGGTPDTGSSLRARIGEKEAIRSAPQAPAASYRSDILSKEDERDNRKRTAADRDKDVGEVNNIPGSDLSSQPLKRPKIIRNRYPGLAKRTLPIDPHAGDKSRSTRKE